MPAVGRFKKRNNMYKKNYAWLMSQLSPWETPQNPWEHENLLSDYRDERPARKPRIHLDEAPGRNPFYIPLSPYDGIDRLTAYSGNYGESYAAASKRQDHHTRFRLGGQQKRRLSLRNTGEESSYGDGPLYQPYPQGTNLLGYDTNGLPLELTVTAPRKHVAKYNDMGNPIYTTDKNLSMGYTTLPPTLEEMARKNALTEIKNRRPGKLTGTAKVMSDLAIGGIGVALAPVALQPLASSLWDGLSYGASKAGSTIAPGSPLWTHPITQQTAYSTLAGTTADAISTALTGNTIGGNVRDMIGWQPEHKWAKAGYNLLTDMANPAYMIGAKRPVSDLIPSPVVPSRGSAQMNHGRNFGPFIPENWNNWGSESLTRLTDNYALKVPKAKTTPVDVAPKSYSDLGWNYRAAVNAKLAANRIPGFEPYEYIGYHTTKDGYVPVFRQNKLALMGMRTPEGAVFNNEAIADIEREMSTHPGLWKNWRIGDYSPGHNIGKNAEGTGRLYDASYRRELITRMMQNFPRKWEISPIGSARLIGNSLERKPYE